MVCDIEHDIVVDDEFRGLIPPLTEEERAGLWPRRDFLLRRDFALEGQGRDKTVFAEILPHALKGYCHVCVMRPVGGMVFTRRGVACSEIGTTLDLMNCDPQVMEWSATPCAPRCRNPWECGPNGPGTGGRGQTPADVYFIQAEGEGLIKIGLSSYPDCRLDAIQANSPARLRIIGIVPEGGYGLEAALHRRFASNRQHHEWFAPTPDLMKWIAAHAQGGRE